MRNNNLIYLPVDNIKFDDLFDWANPLQRSVTHTISAPSLSRQASITGVKVILNAETIALFRVSGDVYAIDAKCPHAGGPLYLGDLEELPDRTFCVRCPWHSWRFDIKTGACLRPKRPNVHARVFPVEVRKDGSLHVGFSSLTPAFFNEDF